jgi:heme/copper-type cytochrome/quinol oxidase subunit 2
MRAQTAVFSTERLAIKQWSWLLFGLATLVIVFLPPAAGKATPASRTLRLETGNFTFNPAVIHVNPGDQVTIELTSKDVVHGLYLDGYDLETEVEPGQTSTFTFTADRPGSFRFRCSVTCGPLHPFMIGKLKVGNNALLWRGIGLAVLAMVIGGMVKMRTRVSAKERRSQPASTTFPVRRSTR